MDDDILVDLKKLGEHLHALARQVESPKVDISKLKTVQECLLLNHSTLESYINVQNMRNM